MFGDIIVERRKLLNMTQSDLADAINDICDNKITYQAVGKWEKGYAFPKVSHLLPLCKVLGLSVDDALSADT